VAFCRVSYRDVDGIEHATDLDAPTLYEAVALAVKLFRDHNIWNLHAPGPGCEFSVLASPQPAVAHRVSLEKVKTFALHGTVQGPAEVLRKERIKAMLGLE